MGVKGLLSYILNGEVGNVVELSVLARKIQIETGKRPKLLCDFFNMIGCFFLHPMLKLVECRDYPEYSMICGPDLHLVAHRALSFAKALQNIGIDPVFFVDAPRGCDESFEGKLDLLKERHKRNVKVAYHHQQVCERAVPRIEQTLICGVNWLIKQVVRSLKEAEAEVVFCHGEADPAIIHYAQTHEETCGILSDDSDFAITSGCVMFPVSSFDLFNLIGLTKGIEIEDNPGDIISLAVSSASLAKSLNIRVNQLPDLAVLCGTDYTRMFIKRFCILAALGVEGDRIEDVAKWLEDKEACVLHHPLMHDLCCKHPELLVAIQQSYENYSIRADSSSQRDGSSSTSYSSPVYELVERELLSVGIMYSVAKRGIIWLPVMTEDFTLGNSCLVDALRPLRKVFYLLLGVAKVQEYGRTLTQCLGVTLVPVCSSPEEVKIGSECMLSVRGLGREAKLSALYRLGCDPPASPQHLQEILHVLSETTHQFPSLDWPRIGKMSLICCGLKALARLNITTKPSLEMSQSELDALLVSCLTCAAEGEIPPHIVHVLPPIRSMVISEWFVRTLGLLYSMYSSFGGTVSTPDPKNVFYPMAFVPYHLSLESRPDLTPKQLVDIQYIQTALHTALSLPAVKAFSSSIFDVSNLQPLPQLVSLCSAALEEVMQNAEKLLPRVMTANENELFEEDEEEEEGGSSSSESREENASIAHTGNVHVPKQTQAVANNRGSVLPIMEHKLQILKLISTHQVVCIEGETGCGKSSQVPQFIISEFESARVLASQPNLLAARKLAERVAEERNESVGKVVGFCDGLEYPPSNTQLTYCTTAYILKVLLKTQDSCPYTHIILDEVHERSTDIDFAMIILQSQAQTQPHLKVVLMSATLQGPLFLDYFRRVLDSKQVADPYFVGTKRFPVNVHFIDDLSGLISRRKDHVQNEVMKQLAVQALKIEKEEDAILPYMAEVIRFTQDVCVNLIISQCSPGDSILVFLPSLGDILDLRNNLVKKLKKLGIESRFKVFVFHHQVPVEEQTQAFNSPSDCMANVIISNHSAESSYTIASLKLVINFAIRMDLVYDVYKRKSQLKRMWCSTASCTQREGRVGRVSQGTAVHLIPKELYEDLPDFNPPEILSSPLSKTVLKAMKIGKMLGEPIPSKFLCKIIEPPSLLQFEAALQDLVECGAILRGSPQCNKLEEASLTPLGSFSLRLPLDLQLCRFIFLGLLLGCPLDAIVMAASVSMYQDIFSLPTRVIMDNLLQYNEALARSTFTRMKFDAGCLSRPIMVRNLFIEWLNFRAPKRKWMASRRDLAFHFCRHNAVRIPRLLHFESFVGEIAQAMISAVPSFPQLQAELRTLANIDRESGGRTQLCSSDFFVKSAPPQPTGKMYLPPHLRNLRFQGKRSEVLHFCQDNAVLKALITAASPDGLICGERRCDSTTQPRIRALCSRCVELAEREGFPPSRTLAVDLSPLDDVDLWAEEVNPTDESAFKKVFNQIRIADRVSFDVETKIFDNLALLYFQPSEEVSDVLVKIARDVGYNPEDCALDSSTAQLSKLSLDVEIFNRFCENKSLWEIDSVKALFPKPFHPCDLKWHLLDEIKTQAEVKFFNYRNPSGFACKFASPSEPLLGVTPKPFFTVSQNLAAPHITILPPFPKALAMALAFQPASADVELLLHPERGRVQGVRINSCEIPCNDIGRFISTELLNQINSLRVALSNAMSSSQEGQRVSLSTTHTADVQEHLHLLLKQTRSERDEVAGPTASDEGGSELSQGLLWERITPGKLLDDTPRSQFPSPDFSQPFYPPFRSSLLGTQPYATTQVLYLDDTSLSFVPVEYPQNLTERILVSYVPLYLADILSEEDDEEPAPASPKWKEKSPPFFRLQRSCKQDLEDSLYTRFRSTLSSRRIVETLHKDTQTSQTDIPMGGLSLARQSLVKLEQEVVRHLQRNNKMEFLSELRVQRRIKFLCASLGVTLKVEFFRKRPESFEVKEVEEGDEGPDAAVSEEEFLILLHPSRWEEGARREEEESPVLPVSMRLLMINHRSAIESRMRRETEEAHSRAVSTAVSATVIMEDKETQHEIILQPFRDTQLDHVKQKDINKQEVGVESVTRKNDRMLLETAMENSGQSLQSTSTANDASPSSSSCDVQRPSKETKKDSMKPAAAVKAPPQSSASKPKKPLTAVVVEKKPNKLEMKDVQQKAEAKFPKKSEPVPSSKLNESTLSLSGSLKQKPLETSVTKDLSKKAPMPTEASKPNTTAATASKKKPAPGSDDHLCLYLVDFIKKYGGETRLSLLRKVAYTQYLSKYSLHKYGSYSYLSKNFLLSFPELFNVWRDSENIIHVQLVQEITDKGGPTAVVSGQNVAIKGNSNNSCSVHLDVKEEKKKVKEEESIKPKPPQKETPPPQHSLPIGAQAKDTHTTAATTTTSGAVHPAPSKPLSASRVAFTHPAPLHTEVQSPGVTPPLYPAQDASTIVPQLVHYSSGYPLSSTVAPPSPPLGSTSMGPTNQAAMASSPTADRSKVGFPRHPPKSSQHKQQKVGKAVEEEWHSSEESWLSEDEFEAAPGSVDHVTNFFHTHLSSKPFPFGCHFSLLDKLYHNEYKRAFKRFTPPQANPVTPDMLSSYPDLFSMKNQLFIKLRGGVDQTEDFNIKGLPYTPEHINGYFSNYLSKEGLVCSVAEAQHVFEETYKKEFPIPTSPVIWFVGDVFFKKSFHIFEVYTDQAVYKC